MMTWVFGKRGRGVVWIVACGLICRMPQMVRADAAGDKKRAQLASVKRVVVVPPFFGTETLEKVFGSEPASEGKPEKEANTTPPGKRPPEPDPRLKQYAEQLRELEAHARTVFAARIAARTPFAVVPAEELNQALKDLKWTPAKLFQNKGRLRGTRFAQPDVPAVRKLAAQLHADAVLLGTLDEPRRTNGGYYFNGVYVDFESGHVNSRAGYFVLLADGTEVLHDYVEALQPLSRLGKREFLLVDWKEAQALAIENFLDELTRYTRPKG